MNIEMTAACSKAFSSRFTHGSSAEARFVEETAKSGRRRLGESNYLGQSERRTFDELFEVATERGVPNWDGYGAEPISSDAYSQAYRFLEALPLSTEPPSVDSEPDGHITLEWYRSPKHTLSVSISPDGDIHYSALFGPNKTYGTEAFFGDPPNVILDLIRRVYAA